MINLKRIISSVLTATILMSTMTIAPFTVSAKETEETTSYESNVEFVTEPTKPPTKTLNSVGASYTENGFTYEVTNNQATITKYSDSTLLLFKLFQTFFCGRSDDSLLNSIQHIINTFLNFGVLLTQQRAMCFSCIAHSCGLCIFYKTKEVELC